MRFIAFVLAALLASAGLAQAQETAVSVAPLVDFVLPILQTLISGVLAIGLPIVLTRLSQRYGLQIEQEKRDALQVTFTNAAGGLLQKLGDQARTLKMDMRNPDVAAAVGRAVRGAPDALRWRASARRRSPSASWKSCPRSPRRPSPRQPSRAGCWDHARHPDAARRPALRLRQPLAGPRRPGAGQLRRAVRRKRKGGRAAGDAVGALPRPGVRGAARDLRNRS